MIDRFNVPTRMAIAWFGGIALTLAISTVSVRGDDAVDFKRGVQPVLEAHCIKCHMPGNAKGELSLATRADVLKGGEDGAAIQPGDADASHLIKMITPGADGKAKMPKKGDTLPADAIAKLRAWITSGAAWPDGVVVRERAKADRTWWSLQPLSDAEPPTTPGAPEAWTRNPIDKFIYAKLAEQHLTPNAPADRRTLIRRVTYDLIGLPPTPEEVEAFVADKSPDAYAKLVDRLLASPHYGERWGRHWLDVARFGESNGFERNVIIDNLWPYRDYVIRSFNDDKPFDRFVREQLAGDVIDGDNVDVAVGTAFLVCGPYDNVGNQDPVQKAQIRANTIDEIVRTTAEAFLGLTVGCARCHNHKFDPIMQADYYALCATFAGVYHGSRDVATPDELKQRAEALAPLNARLKELDAAKAALDKSIAQNAKQREAEATARWTRPPVDRYGTEERFDAVDARYVRLVAESRDDQPNARAGFGIDEFEVWTAGEATRNVALASNGAKAEGASRVAPDFADAYAAKNAIDGRFGARWISTEPTLTITLADTQRVDRVVFSSDRIHDLPKTHVKTRFVGDYHIDVSLDGKTWTTVADSSDRKPPSAAHAKQRLRDATITPDEQKRLAKIAAEKRDVQAQIAKVPSPPSWWVGQFRAAPGPFNIFVGGSPQRPGDAVHAASPSTLMDVAKPYTLDDKAPESQRRMALAEWIVADDNPLTPRVLANRLWHWHFGTGIQSTPSDFGYMGGRPTHPELLDWLARQLHASGWQLKPLHRLIVTSQTYRQSSAFRDDAAQVDSDARLLWRFPPRRLSGEEIRDSELAIAGKLDTRMGGPGFRLYEYQQDNVATYVPLDRFGPETYRRAVYHQNARAQRVDVMTDFDCPDPAFAAPRRSATTTPLQALTMLNHNFTMDMAGALAERLQREAGKDAASQVRRAFLLAFAREPSADEADAAQRLITQHGLRALCRALLNSNELIYIN
ncbi:MAG: DUF1553 domain-containing protein [Phycisphaera sp.]|nr:DUF1553 domain-containing protein [Phycisphaera sp.]